jgi:antitoxin (DNA-binding transcriptional repressor) of toxin-antitoxin stability system
MKKLRISEASASLAEYAQTIDEPVVIVKGGKPIAALVPIRGADWESFSLSTNSDFIDLIVESRRRHEREGGISLEEMRQRLGLQSDTSGEVAALPLNGDARTKRSAPPSQARPRRRRRAPSE